MKREFGQQNGPKEKLSFISRQGYTINLEPKIRTAEENLLLLSKMEQLFRLHDTTNVRSYVCLFISRNRVARFFRSLWPKFYSDKTEKMAKNCQILQNGQMRFFMASAVKKWPNFSKLAMKWPIWQPCPGTICFSNVLFPNSFL